MKEMTDVGVGDDEKSWAVDGFRRLKWNGDSKTWKCSWKDGTVVGLAANVDTGMIAASVNGLWSSDKDDLGIVFQGDLITKGVFPCFTASAYKLRYSVTESDWKYEPPPDALWTPQENDI